MARYPGPEMGLVFTAFLSVEMGPGHPALPAKSPANTEKLLFVHGERAGRMGGALVVRVRDGERAGRRRTAASPARSPVRDGSAQGPRGPFRGTGVGADLGLHNASAAS